MDEMVEAFNAVDKAKDKKNAAQNYLFRKGREGLLQSSVILGSATILGLRAAVVGMASRYPATTIFAKEVSVAEATGMTVGAGVATKVVREMASDFSNPTKVIPTISDDVARTFANGKYSATVLDEPLTLYRVFGGKAKEVGQYWSKNDYSGKPDLARLELALKPEWGNTADKSTKIVVPKGTVVYDGVAAPQLSETGAWLPGGGSQVYIPRIDDDWFE